MSSAIDIKPTDIVTFLTNEVCVYQTQVLSKSNDSFFTYLSLLVKGKVVFAVLGNEDEVVIHAVTDHSKEPA